MIKRYRIGTVLGIPIEVDVSLLLVIPLIAWAIASDIARIVQVLSSVTGVQLSAAAVSASPWPWLLGALCAIGLFCSVALHELGHSVVALRSGYDIEAIKLWLLGGIAQFADEPEEWADELAIAVAGPAVSIGLGAAGVALLFVVPPSLSRLQFFVGYLGVLNLALAAFNLLPGFPMDGGRILRALLSRNRSLPEATDLAATVGKVVAVGFGIVAILSFHLLLLAIAFFIYLGASAEARETRARANLAGTTVSDLMTPADAVETVSSDTTLSGLLDRMYRQRHTGYPVVDDGQVKGIVTLADISDVDAAEHDTTAVAAVMSTDLQTVGPDASAYDALEAMNEENIGRLLVTDESASTVGLVSRTDLMTALAVARTTPRPRRRPTNGGLAGD
ncbi:MAG: Zn-dependent protease/predicted transcriptional regulator [Natronomonas sp.]|jgi:Zn-dependent protease/predicted transcriptional regulator